jgi:hypothetical protein
LDIHSVHDIREEISNHGIRLIGSHDLEPFGLSIGELLG